jgi:hypothetical protein
VLSPQTPASTVQDTDPLITNTLTALAQGFVPAFRDLSNGETHISTLSNGEYLDYHTMDNLPIEWVESWDDEGYAVALKPTIVAGYIRYSEFYSLLDIANPRLDG